ncbi:RNA methyltransferase [Desulfallas sp. Bu1-1]|uniref:TrmH family RNA methyltransferase n=1 Tax=Desulfallas sp. Bu1-1 TaxID=2787620 RepID=UPI00189ECD2B|nr:RNA methyltransferase [Desulfallas sp. Bu1-1]MBF7083910.1 RNA methyltransferase [Desulfallas sp. Bu1-1]
MLVNKNNSRIKYVRRLAKRKFRESEGKFIVEGVRFVEEAVQARWPLELVLHTLGLAGHTRGKTLLEMLAEQGVPLLAVDDGLLAELADTESPQGVLAVAGIPRHLKFDPEAWRRDGKDLLVLVDGVRDPGNLGTIIRCADAAGAHGVFIFKGTVDPYNAKTLRSTMGSVFHIPVISVADVDKFLFELQTGGWKLVAGDLAARRELYNCDLTGQVALVIGGEACGISDVVRRAAGERVRIPMPGRAESLNAGVAAGIMLYEAVRQRLCAGKEIAKP